MNDLQSLSAYPVGARPEGVIEEVTVKGKKRTMKASRFGTSLMS